MSRLVIPYMGGIMLGRYFPEMILFPLMLVAMAFPLLTAAAWFFRQCFGYRRRWIPGLVLSVALAGLGWLSCAFFLMPPSEAHYAKQVDVESSLTGVLRITDKAIPRQGRSLVFAEVIALTDGMSLSPSYGKVRVTVRHEEDESLGLTPGSYWMVSASIRDPFKSLNSWEFDYAKWLRYKGVHHVLYLDACEMTYLGSPRYSYRAWGVKQQERMTEYIREMGLDTSSAGMAGAMLFGEKSSLQPDDSESFRKAGVMHVLCVSGLHAGAVYAGALFLIAGVFRGRKLKPWVPLISLIPVITFACITGLAPSVCRATLMLSLHATGRLAKRRTEGVNIMSGAAFIMLWSEAPLLFDLGFQFSFLAVASIMLLAIPAARAGRLTGKGLKPAIGGLALVSLAAQAGTAPLSIFHFHAFPSYFLPANLVVVPLSTIVIYTGMISILLQMAGICPLPLQWLFHHMVKWMGEVVRFWGEIPGSAIQDIPFNWHDSILVYMLLLFVSAMLFGRRRWYWQGLFFCLMLWGIAGIYQKWERMESTGMVVLSAKPYQVVAWQGRQSWYLDQESEEGQLGSAIIAFLQSKGLQRGRARDLLAFESLKSTGFQYCRNERLAMVLWPGNRLLIVPLTDQKLVVPETDHALYWLLPSAGQYSQPRDSLTRAAMTLIMDQCPSYFVDKYVEKGGLMLHEIKKKGCFRF